MKDEHRNQLKKLESKELQDKVVLLLSNKEIALNEIEIDNEIKITSNLYYNIGCIFFDGNDGIKEDKHMALSLFVIASKRGCKHGLYNAGICFYKLYENYKNSNGIEAQITQSSLKNAIDYLEQAKEAQDQGKKFEKKDYDLLCQLESNFMYCELSNLRFYEKNNNSEEKLLKIKNLSQDDKLLLDILRFAIDKDSNVLIKYILRYDIPMSKVSESDKKKFLKFSIKKDNLTLAKNILLCYAPKEDELTEIKANGDIDKFLSYTPGKGQHSMKINCLQAANSRTQRLEKLFQDQENTTDESSSDSENDNVIFLKPELNDTNLEDLLYRGVHFNLKFFNSKQRKAVKNESYHRQPVHSAAVLELARENNTGHEHAINLVKCYFSTLKTTANRRESSPNGKLNRKKKGEDNFNNLYEHFIQAYINSYDSLFLDGGIKRNFNFCINSNPIISTIKKPANTSKYIIGEAVDVESRYIPKLRKSTGIFKHRRFGYIHVYAVDKNYHKNHAVHVGSLKNSGTISPGARRETEEVFFETSIPSEYIFGYKVFSLPNFKGEWSKEIEKEYGLNKAKYDEYRKKIFDLEDGQDSSLITDIIKTVTIHQIKIFYQSIAEKKKTETEQAHIINHRHDNLNSQRLYDRHFGLSVIADPDPMLRMYQMFVNSAGSAHIAPVVTSIDTLGTTLSRIKIDK